MEIKSFHKERSILDGKFILKNKTSIIEIHIVESAFICISFFRKVLQYKITIYFR